jgi:hypothetical protein
VEHTITRGSLAQFDIACRAADLETPASIRRALELLNVIDDYRRLPPASYLAMTDDEARKRVKDLTIRHGTFGTESGFSRGSSAFQASLLEELAAAVVPELDHLIVELQPAFDEAAAPIVTAAQVYGFHWGTTSDDVIDRNDDKATAAWRDTRTAIAAIRPIAQLRVLMSKLFGLSPTLGDAESLLHRWGDLDESLISHSICFAAGDNWALDGTYNLRRKAGGIFDWLAIASGGLHLNTDAEVKDKLALAARVG